LTANASRLFAIAALLFCALPRWATVAALLIYNGQRNHHAAEITSAISPFGG
jgi:hypothetical protein